MPSEATPAGTEQAGFHARLASIVNGTFIAPAAGAEALLHVLAGDRGRWRATGVERRDRGGRRHQHVEVAEDRRTVGVELQPPTQWLGERADRTFVGCLEAVAYPARHVLQATGVVLALVDLEP